MNEKLKKLIFDKLYDDLKNVEIILHKRTNSIWFVDREKRYWYLIYEKTQGVLHWRFEFFYNFFHLFSMDKDEFQPILSELVEEVLNCKVNTPLGFIYHFKKEVDEVLNCKISKLLPQTLTALREMDYVLNNKENISFWNIFRKPNLVKDSLSL